MTSTRQNAKNAVLVRLGQDDSLDRWIEYVYGDLRCKCEYAWKGLGRFGGADMGKGWVRITTHSECVHHGTEAEQERAVRIRERYRS